MNFKEYIEKVKEHLECNMSEDDKKVYYHYSYTEKELDGSIEYFEKCYAVNLSAYKALLYFHDYLNGDYVL